MANKHSDSALRRQWSVLNAIAATRNGLTLEELREKTGIPRSTVFRYLGVLRDAGIPLSPGDRLGGGRYRLLTQRELPPATLTGAELAALFFARAALEPLAGADFVEVLDRFLLGFRVPAAQQSFRFAAGSAPRPKILKVLDSAVRSGRRVSMVYRSRERRGTPKTSLVEPLVISVMKGEPYLHAYSLEHGGERTYKLARIEHAEFTAERAGHRPKARAQDPFRQALKAWSGPSVSVRVRLDRSVAWLADEYALPGQRVEADAEGSVVLHANVAGLVEARRYVLSWGPAAEALEPPELRDATRADLEAALAKYAPKGPMKARGRTPPGASSSAHTPAHAASAVTSGGFEARRQKSNGHSRSVSPNVGSAGRRSGR